MDFFLVAVTHFGRFKPGDVIENVDDIQTILGGECRSCVVRVGVPTRQVS